MPASTPIAGRLASSDWPRLRARLRRIGIVDRLLDTNASIKRWIADPTVIGAVARALDDATAKTTHVNLLATAVVLDFDGAGRWLVRIAVHDDRALVFVEDGHLLVDRAPIDRLLS